MSTHISPSVGRTRHNLPYNIWISQKADVLLRSGGTDQPIKDLLDTIGIVHGSHPMISRTVSVVVASRSMEFHYYFQPTNDEWILHIDLPEENQ